MESETADSGGGLARLTTRTSWSGRLYLLELGVVVHGDLHRGNAQSVVTAHPEIDVTSTAG